MVYSQDDVKLSIQQSKDAILTELILAAVWTVLVFQFLIDLRVMTMHLAFRARLRGRGREGYYPVHRVLLSPSITPARDAATPEYNMFI